MSKSLPILSIQPTQGLTGNSVFTPFAIRLKSDDSISSTKTRIAKKLGFTIGTDVAENDLEVKYLFADVYYRLDDDEDFDIFLTRSHPKEITVILSCPSLPDSQKSHQRESSGHSEVSVPGSAGVDSGSVRTTGRSQQSKETTLHVVDSSLSSLGDGASMRSGRSAKGDGGDDAKSVGTNGTAKKRKGADAKSLAESIPAHKIAFENFHNQLGVRTFVGSIGEVDNVRMMMKPGHRYVYMSRAFAQQHAFIPKDAAPGFYGFSGITNLGSWPIKVGEKTIDQQVQLVENSYFPIILGRSFMEKRGVKISALDPTTVVFMDTGETIPCDLVIVKDASGQVVPIS